MLVCAAILLGVEDGRPIPLVRLDALNTDSPERRVHDDNALLRGQPQPQEVLGDPFPGGRQALAACPRALRRCALLECLAVEQRVGKEKLLGCHVSRLQPGGLPQAAIELQRVQRQRREVDQLALWSPTCRARHAPLEEEVEELLRQRAWPAHPTWEGYRLRARGCRCRTPASASFRLHPRPLPLALCPPLPLLAAPSRRRFRPVALPLPFGASIS
mmetsp:Transcript_39456/g.114206  ORF Transcript_39456/g.114206 Transcript_39456/m.114206 type:complete len:216 (-) Transcript_39456:245-892(-)